METVKVNIYRFDELSEEAKEHALEKWNEHDQYNWLEEAKDTIKAFEQEFGVELKSWGFTPYDYNFHLYTGKIDDDVLALKGNRARAWFWNKVGHLLLKPRTEYWTRHEGKLIRAVSVNSIKRKSKCFFDRCYDGTCPWTGVFCDNNMLDPIAYFCFGTRWDDKLEKRVQDYDCRTLAKDDRNTVESILNDCCDSFFKALQDDYAYQESMENFAETCENNNYRFTEDGEMWSGELEAKEERIAS